MTALSKDDYRQIIVNLDRVLFGGRPATPEEQVGLRDLRDRVGQRVVESRTTEETGALVLEWRIPREWTTPKSGKGIRPWVLGTLKDKLGDDLRAKLASWPAAPLNCARRRRWVQVRRYSNKKPDRPTCPDCLGARQAIDLLKDLEIIVDDDTKWTVDDSNWIACKQGMTHIIIRVFEVVTEGGKVWPEPECLPPPKPEKKVGRMTKAIIGDETKPKRRAFGRQRFAKKDVSA